MEGGNDLDRIKITKDQAITLIKYYAKDLAIQTKLSILLEDVPFIDDVPDSLNEAKTNILYHILSLYLIAGREETKEILKRTLLNIEFSDEDGDSQPYVIKFRDEFDNILNEYLYWLEYQLKTGNLENIKDLFIFTL